MRTHIFTASLLLVVPLAAGCGRASAETADTDGVPPSAVIGVAGNCPADAGPMRPGPAGTIADLNGDGYVCISHVNSAGDTMRLTVDNDAAPAEGAPREPDTYSGM
jgi:hypothetical protein